MTAGETNPPPIPKRRRRFLWLKILGGVLIFLTLLVILAPTILSTAPVRNYVVGKINENLNGRLAIKDWSAGWFGGVDVDGLQVFDTRNQLVLAVHRVHVPISLISALRGNYDLGDVVIDDPDLVKLNIGDNGELSYQMLVKEEPAASGPRPATGPAMDHYVRLPAVRGNIVISGLRGTITSPFLSHTLYLDPASSVDLKITSLTEPVQTSVKLVYRLGDSGVTSSISTGGPIAIFRSQEFDPDKFVQDLNFTQKIELADTDLDVLGVIAPFLGRQLRISGVANGSIDVKMSGVNSIAADGLIHVANLKISGDIFKGGEFYQTAKLDIPIHATRIGLDSKTIVLKIANLQVATDQATLTISGDMPESLLVGLPADGTMPDYHGNMAVNLNVNLASLAAQMPRTLGLTGNSAVNGGKLAMAVNVDMAPGRIVLSNKLSVDGLSLQGKAPLTPISYTTQATLVPGKGGLLSRLRDPLISFKSSFADIHGAGSDLGNLQFKGNIDLDKLDSDLGQFADLGLLKLAGKVGFSLTTVGDPTDVKQPLTADASLTIKDLKVAGLAGLTPIDEPSLNVSVTGKFLRGSDRPLKSIHDLLVQVFSGQDTAPTAVAVVAADDVEFPPASGGPFVVQGWKINKLFLDLPRFQRDYGRLIPLLSDGTIELAGGQLQLTGSGSYDGATQVVELATPMVLATKDVCVKSRGRVVFGPDDLDLSAAGDLDIAGRSINLSALSLTTASRLLSVKSSAASLEARLEESGIIRGRGGLVVSADLKRLGDLLWDDRVRAADAARLTGGRLDATVTLADAPDGRSALDAQFAVSGLDVQTPKATIQNQSITLSLQALADAAALDISKLNIDSPLITLALADTHVLLSTGAGAAAHRPGPADMLAKADLRLDVPDIAALWAAVEAWMPPSHESPNAIEFQKGQIHLALGLRRDHAAKKTWLDGVDLSATGLVLQRGSDRYACKNPQVIKLSAAVDTDDPETFRPTALDVTQLSGDLDLGTLRMPQPITITDLDGALKASGSIELAGRLSDLSAILWALGGQKEQDRVQFSGDYALTQAAQTQGQNVNIAGTLALSHLNFVPGAASHGVAIAEDRLNLADDFSLDAAAGDLVVRALNLDMVSSDMLHLSLSGALRDYRRQCRFDDVRLKFTPDWQKVWAAVWPLLSASQRNSLDGLVLSGRDPCSLTLSGIYPPATPMHEAIQSLRGAAQLAIGHVEFKGITLDKAVIPLTLDHGVIHVAYADRADVAPAIACNGGTINLASADGGLSIDLTGPHMRLSSPKNLDLLKGIQINKVLAQNCGKTMPWLIKLDKASGTLDVRIDYCDRLPLDDFLTSPDNDGKAQFTINVPDLDIRGGMLASIFSAGGISSVFSSGGMKKGGLQGSITDGRVVFAGPVATHDVIILVNNQAPLEFEGNLDLPKDYYNHLYLKLSGKLLQQGIFSIVHLRLPGEWTIGFYGPPNKLKVDSKTTLGSMLLGQPANNNDQGNGGSNNGGGDLGDVLKGLFKKK